MAGGNFHNRRARGKKRAFVITALVFLILLIPAGTLALFAYSQARAASVRIVSDRETLVDLAGTALSAKLTKLVGVISNAASSKEVIADVSSGDFKDGAAFIQSLESNPSLSDSYIEKTVLLNASGTEMAGYPAPLAESISLPKTWDINSWQSAFAGGQPFYISGVIDGDDPPSSVVLADIIIVVPIRSAPAGAIQGYGLIQVPTEDFLNFDRNISVGSSGYVYLVDQDSNIIADPKDASDTLEIVSDASDAAADLAVAGQSGTRIQADSAGDGNNFIAYAPVPDYHWGVIITEPYQETFAASQSILTTMEAALILFAIMAIVALLLIFYFLNRHYENQK